MYIFVTRGKIRQRNSVQQGQVKYMSMFSYSMKIQIVWKPYFHKKIVNIYKNMQKPLS